MKKIVVVLLVLALISITACTRETDTGEKEEMRAPVIRLTDSLSSTANQFEVQSGNYNLSYPDGKEMQGVVACGSHPLDQSQEKYEKLKLPSYNGIDYVPCLLSCDIEPDRLTVKEWEASQSGDTEAAESADKVYEDSFLLELKPGKIYEITADWKEENLDKNGFYGKASYAVRTE